MKKQNIVDFDNLNFHDNKIYAIGFDEINNEFLIDVDFITSWIEKTNIYAFRSSPSTIVFENVWDIEFDISMDMALIINNIIRANPQTPRNIKYLEPASKEYDWNIELLQGCIKFKSIGMKIYKRKNEIDNNTQDLTKEERGDISLKKEGFKITVV